MDLFHSIFKKNYKFEHTILYPLKFLKQVS